MKQIRKICAATLLILSGCSEDNTSPGASSKAPATAAAAGKITIGTLPDSIEEGQTLIVEATANAALLLEKGLRFKIEILQGKDVLKIERLDGYGYQWQVDIAEVSTDTNVEILITATDANGKALKGSDGKAIEAKVAFKILNYDRTPLATQWNASPAIPLRLISGSLLDIQNENDSVFILHRPEYVVRNGNNSELQAKTAISQLKLRATDQLAIPNTHRRFPEIETWGDAQMTFISANAGADPDIVLISPTAGKVTEEEAAADDALDEYEGGKVKVFLSPSQLFFFSTPKTEISLAGVCKAVPIVEYDASGDKLTYASLLLATPKGLFLSRNQGNVTSADAGKFTAPVQVAGTAANACHLEWHHDDNAVFYDTATNKILSVTSNKTGSSNAGNGVSITELVTLKNKPQDGQKLTQFMIGSNGKRDVPDPTDRSRTIKKTQHIFAMVFSDGKHDGKHSFVAALEDTSGNIPADHKEQRIELPNGVPTDMAISNIDYWKDPSAAVTAEDTDDDILLAVPDTPYVYVLRKADGTQDKPVNYALEYHDVGLGLEQISLSKSADAPKALFTLRKGSVFGLYPNTERPPLIPVAP